MVTAEAGGQSLSAAAILVLIYSSFHRYRASSLCEAHFHVSAFRQC